MAFSGGSFILDFKRVAFSVSAGTEKAVYNVSSFVGESVAAVRELWDLKSKYNELSKQLEKYELLERSNADIKRENEELSTNGLYNSFCSGFCNGVEQELKKNCTALMLVTPKKVVESFEKFSETFKTRDNSISAIDKEAYTFGEIEGKRALNAQYIEGE